MTFGICQGRWVDQVLWVLRYSYKPVQTIHYASSILDTISSSQLCHSLFFMLRVEILDFLWLLSATLQLMVMLPLKGTEGGWTDSPGGSGVQNKNAEGVIQTICGQSLWRFTIWLQGGTQDPSEDYPEIVYSSVQRAFERLMNLMSNADSMIVLEQLTLTCFLKRSWEFDSPANMYLVECTLWLRPLSKCCVCDRTMGSDPSSHGQSMSCLYSQQKRICCGSFYFSESILLFKFSHNIQYKLYLRVPESWLSNSDFYNKVVKR